MTGKLRQRSYETKDGEKRTVYKVEADEVGVSIKSATAKVQRVSHTSTNPSASTGTGSNGGQRQAEADPWAADASGGFSDEPPF